METLWRIPDETTRSNRRILALLSAVSFVFVLAVWYLKFWGIVGLSVVAIIWFSLSPISIAPLGVGVFRVISALWVEPA